jgi:hypothetical protein
MLVTYCCHEIKKIVYFEALHAPFTLHHQSVKELPTIKFNNWCFFLSPKSFRRPGVNADYKSTKLLIPVDRISAQRAQSALTQIILFQHIQSRLN